MGFPFAESEAAIHSYGTVQAALEALLAGKGELCVRIYTPVLWSTVTFKLEKVNNYVLGIFTCSR